MMNDNLFITLQTESKKLKTTNMKRILTICMLLASVWTLHAQSFETAADAVKNMGVGWNLGNTLDANDGKECPDIVRSETMWGQPVTKPELMKMMKEAGFGAIRVPVTWYPHMDATGKVDAVWMARVHEVVDYVLDNGMYCILNVHHDTGDGPMWLHASTNVYNNVKERYEYLWTQIAEEFKGYGEKLLFESYNEMLDEYNSWCFASFATSGNYNATSAADSYDAINRYVQTFVDAVRATGGNNAKRNLIVNTYGACNGGGSWNSHLKDPLKEMKLPTDATAGEGHIAFEVHAYPTLASGRSETDDIVNQLNTYLLTKAPVIMGEWGTSNADPNESDYMKDPAKYLEFVKYFVEKTKAKNIAAFYWMGLTDGAYRSQPAFNQPDVAEAIVKAYHGSSDGFKYPTIEPDGGTIVCFEGEKELDWGNGVYIAGTSFAAFKSAELVLTYKPTKAGSSDIQLFYGDWSVTPTFAVDGRTYNGDYYPGGSNGVERTTTFTFDDATHTTLTQKGLIIHGNGITLSKAVLQAAPTGITPVTATHRHDQRIYNLNGQQITNPRHGIFIQNGKKFVVK